MKEALWCSLKGFIAESVFAEMWSGICNLLKICLTGAYNLSFYVLIIFCMYNIILAMFGSKEGKVNIVKSVLIFAIIEMIFTMIGVA